VNLKRLELLGFKSFPEKTVIKLTGGVTGIVGPNGCGKSNVLDAMRWVLGEQKVSLLRGSKMEEIIFNGTRELKPLGMAEVTLVMQNTKGRLPTEYSEVQITRRLFRSGESEYLLNKVPCRLKDITDLLMDTGVGAHVYSMIQQDMVDAILSDRTDDRRFLFEEAAGISKYKNRKKAALRKLESTEQDLLRLQDIVSEVTTQTNSLKRQVRKAERYQELSEEYKKWELYLSKQAINNLNKERTAKKPHMIPGSIPFQQNRKKNGNG
jgi:chromosome segregation protein